MADFSPSFGSTGGNTRLPTVDEQQNGFPCGPADPALFAGLFRRLEEEMQSVFSGAGIAGSDSDNTILYQSILALIAAATGGSGDYVLMTQARARLPIYPDVLHVDGHLNVTSPGTGQVRVPAGRIFQHRGIFQVTTAQTDFATLASKTYHLRWNPTDGFALKDLADVAYNPSSLAETNAAFDSTFDDMLVARVTTNSSNVVTPTNLLNKVRLSAQSSKRTALADNVDWVTLAGSAVALNWARTPMFKPIVGINEIRAANVGPPGPLGPSNGVLRGIGARISTYTRYSIADIQYYYEDDQTGTPNGNGLFAVDLMALAV